MRIFHYHRDLRLEKGGVVRFVLDVCGAMAARGHDVVLATPGKAELPAGWENGGPGLPRALRLAEPRRPLDLWRRKDLPDVEQALDGSDVAHVHGPWLPTNVQLGRMALRLGIPYVATPHGMLDDWSMAQKTLKKRVFYAMFGRALFERAALVHVTAQGELDQSRKWFPRARKTAIVPPVVDLEIYKSLPGPEEARAAFPPPLADKPVVLFLSRVHPQKCCEVLIDACALLKARGVDCNLFIAGPGESAYVASLEARAAERGVADRTRLLGMVKGRMKVSLYQLADVFALPSPQESFGLVLAEAMACGTPAVTTRQIDIGPDLEASGGALLADLTAEGFAEVLGRVLTNPDLRARLSGAARAWVLDYLDPQTVAVQYETMYEGIRTR